MGGSRFIGKHLLQKLSVDDHITVVNRGSVPAEKYLPPGAEQVSLDRNEADAMASALAGKAFDLVFDVSAVTGDHVRILLDALEQPPRRHVHVSSGSVYDIYGEDTPIFWQPIAEGFPIGRIHEDEHPYMNAKRSAEKVLQEEFEALGYPMVIVRPTFVYGPDNYIYREAYFFDRLHHDRPLILPNKGHGFQDLVFVDDLADLLIEVSQRPAEEVVGEAFNGTKGDLITANMLAKLVGKIMDKSPEILYADIDQLQEMQWPPERALYPYIPEGGS
ncbi:MAG TPA: NAD-dependent epimerase/dehydratase family protein, partial [Pseudodesulfovibrio sp.]|nr:NAD-dependent epimerase/dehydratase family protein [Pseudodesulfovibrio sp.]